MRRSWAEEQAGHEALHATRPARSSCLVETCGDGRRDAPLAEELTPAAGPLGTGEGGLGNETRCSYLLSIKLMASLRGSGNRGSRPRGAGGRERRCQSRPERSESSLKRLGSGRI